MLLSQKTCATQYIQPKKNEQDYAISLEKWNSYQLLYIEQKFPLVTIMITLISIEMDRFELDVRMSSLRSIGLNVH